MKVGDIDLGRGTIRIHGKGGKIVVLPIGFSDLKTDLEVHLVGRNPDEYLIYPKADTSRPMDAASMHRWFKRCWSVPACRPRSKRTSFATPRQIISGEPPAT
jgi:hypothetical protein